MPLQMTLNPKEEEKLEEWLLTKRIILNNRTRRDLSDVVTIAQLFKKLDTHLVNMDNYASHSSLALKLENWEAFNFKVLRRVGLLLSSSELEELALGRLNALKALLYHLMCMERDGGAYHVVFPKKKTITDTKKTEETRKPLQFSKDTSTGEKQINDLITNVPHNKHVPYSKYELLMNENYKKDIYISSINHKVQYLESLILVKEERINNLLQDLDSLSSRTPATPIPLNGDVEQPQIQPNPINL